MVAESKVPTPTGSATCGSPAEVVVVDDDGRTIGLADRGRAHEAPGLLHLAFSVQLIDPARGWLLQQRAQEKAAFASCWANTCCSHAVADEEVATSARRRVIEELGLRVGELMFVGQFRYRARDARSGLVEHELDSILYGTVDSSQVDPDPGEVADIAVLPFGRALERVSGASGAPWAAAVLERTKQFIDRAPTGEG